MPMCPRRKHTLLQTKKLQLLTKIIPYKTKITRNHFLKEKMPNHIRSRTGENEDYFSTSFMFVFPYSINSGLNCKYLKYSLYYMDINERKRRGEKHKYLYKGRDKSIVALFLVSSTTTGNSC